METGSNVFHYVIKQCEMLIYKYKNIVPFLINPAWLTKLALNSENAVDK